MRLTVRGVIAVAVVGLATLVMLSLGFWQLGRLQDRRAENVIVAERLAQPPLDLNRLAAEAPGATPGAPPEYQPVVAAGAYDFKQEIVLRNRAYLDSPGVRVLTPLRLHGSEAAVLVDRGWVPYELAEAGLRQPFQAPTGPVTVTGIVRPSQQRQYDFLPGDPTLSPDMPRLDAWFWLDVDQIQGQVPYPLLPFYVEAAPDPAADPLALPIAGYEVDLSNGPHLSYAVQWFAFAAILVGGAVALTRVKPAGQVPPPPRY